MPTLSARDVIEKRLNQLAIPYDQSWEDAQLWELLPEEAKAELKEEIALLAEQPPQENATTPKVDEEDENAEKEKSKRNAAPKANKDKPKTQPRSQRAATPKVDEKKVTMKGNLRMDGKIYEQGKVYTVSEVIRSKMEEIGIV